MRDAAVGRQQLLQVVVVVRARARRPRRDRSRRGSPVDGELRAHAAVLGQQVAERDAPDLLRDAVGEERVEPGLGARPGDLAFGEGRHVLQADVLRDVPALVADMLEIVGAAERPALAHLAGRRVGRRVVVVE